MRKIFAYLFFVAVFIECLVASNTIAQPAMCTVTATLRNQAGQAQKGMKVTISNVRLDSNLISLGPIVYTSDVAGFPRNAAGDTIRLPRGSTACIECYVGGFNVPGGACVEIPDTNTISLEFLQPLATVGTAGISVQNNDVSVGRKHSTLDFSSSFVVTQAPVGEANIALATDIITNATIAADAAIARSKIAAGNAHRMVINNASGNLSELAALTNGQIPIGTTGGAVTGAGITGTSNQITVSPGAGSITLSTPQNLHTTALVQFMRLLLDSLRFTDNGGISVNDDTLYFRKADGSVAFKIYLGASPSSGQILKAGTANELTFESDATGGGGGITNAEYIVNTLTSDLSNERRIFAGNGLSSTDGGANSTFTLRANATDGVVISSDTLRVLLRTLSGLLIKTGASAVDSVAADSASVLIQTKTENNALYVPLARMITTGDGLKGGGDLSTNRTFDIMATDGVKISGDTVRVQLTTASGLQIKPGVSPVDSLQIKLDGTTLSKSTAGVKIASGGITTTEIFDGTITNQDVDTAAGIERSKLASGNADRLLVNDGSGVISEIAALTNGQLVIGSTGAAPVVAALTGGNGIITTPGAGSLTVDVNPKRSGPGRMIITNDSLLVDTDSIDSTRVTKITSGDIRDAAIGATQLAPTAVTAGNYSNPILTIDADGRITAAVPGPIRFSVDSASTMACDTMLVWQNMTGSTITVDSINVAARSDDYAISIIKCDYNGKNGVLVDAVTASMNGTNLFFITETTISSASVANGQWLGFKRPASTGEGVFVRIHYH